jgi:hypothetical protein
MCWGVDPDTLMGTCIAFCAGSEANPICEQACHACVIGGESVVIPCLPECDPLMPACGQGSCVPWGGTYICVPDASERGGAPGDPCDFLNDCDAGSFCASPGCRGGSGCCAAFCDPLAADPCPGMPDDVECVPLDDGGGSKCTGGPVGGCLVPR